MKVVRRACKSPNAIAGSHGGMLLGCDTDRLALPRSDACSTNATLLLLNSGIWDLLDQKASKTCCDYDANFEDHVGSLRGLLSTIQQEFPNVAIGWKSMTAAHVHRTACGTQGGDSIEKCLA